MVRDPEAHTRKLIMFIVMSYPLLIFSKTGLSSHSLPLSAWRKSVFQQRGKNKLVFWEGVFLGRQVPQDGFARLAVTFGTVGPLLWNSALAEVAANSGHCRGFFLSFTRTL